MAQKHREAKTEWAKIVAEGDRAKIEGASRIVAVYTDTPGFGREHYEGAATESKPKTTRRRRQQLDEDNDE